MEMKDVKVGMLIQPAGSPIIKKVMSRIDTGDNVYIRVSKPIGFQQLMNKKYQVKASKYLLDEDSLKKYLKFEDN